MTILLKNSVFFHTPKTGGQWITAALERANLIVGQVGVVHSCPSETRGLPECNVRPYSFAFVRHPVSWYQSMWAHQMDEQWEGIDDPAWIPSDWIDLWSAFCACGSEDFNEFVSNCVQRFPNGFVSQLFDAYTEGCDHVGKQENIADDLVHILDATGAVFDEQLLRETPQKNVRGRRDHHRRRNRYNEHTLLRIKKAESKAIERFGYSEFEITN